MENLLSKIASDVARRVEERGSPVSIMDVVFQQLHYSLSDDAAYPEEAVKFLSEMTINYRSFPPGFATGNMGALWAMGYLWKHGAIDKPERLTDIANEIIGHNSSYFFDSPVRFNPDEPIYPFGVVMMPLLTDEDALGRYVLEEQIILRLCDCERIISECIPGIHYPGELSASMLHSIAAFARLAELKGVFPFKAKEIRRKIAEMSPYGKVNPNDRFILDFVCGRNPCADDFTTNELRAELLDYTGMISALYEWPELFQSALKLINNEIPINVSTGTGIGMLNLLLHEQDIDFDLHRKD